MNAKRFGRLFYSKQTLYSFRFLFSLSFVGSLFNVLNLCYNFFSQSIVSEFYAFFPSDNKFSCNRYLGTVDKLYNSVAIVFV